ncbi:MAG TPA: hypothetical protein VH678_30015 [Xanthobacteraceae bacterium]
MTDSPDGKGRGIYGWRVRIGYTSPPLATEVFPYEFYQMVPAGVTLVLTAAAAERLGRAGLRRGAGGHLDFQLGLEIGDHLLRAGMTAG